MRILVWILRLAIFLFLFGFAVKNDQLVDLRFFMGGEWELPLVFVILIFFAVGAVLGATMTMISLFKLRREISRLRKRVNTLESTPPAGSPPVAEAQSPESL
ncbi:MAG: LapA family protein [Rhodocyclaceae bacterium]|nr:LapA family protein [Rhodocyclaceae bacterium]MCP5238303.1 LapA family protein [Zoogloeaceae bacterium]MCW5616124.1 LapA family protein [Rhodocyclaceae bacterium]